MSGDPDEEAEAVLAALYPPVEHALDLLRQARGLLEQARPFGPPSSDPVVMHQQIGWEMAVEDVARAVERVDKARRPQYTARPATVEPLQLPDGFEQIHNGRRVPEVGQPLEMYGRWDSPSRWSIPCGPPTQEEQAKRDELELQLAVEAAIDSAIAADAPVRGRECEELIKLVSELNGVGWVKGYDLINLAVVRPPRPRYYRGRLREHDFKFAPETKCPVRQCAAEPGSPCVTRNGKPTGSHKGRAQGKVARLYLP